MFFRKLLCVSLVLAVAACALNGAQKKVVFVAFDGWAAKGFEQAEMPNIKKVYENGSRTLRKRSVLPSSSAPNWASMFMGVGTELHGYSNWNSAKPDFPFRAVSKYGAFPGILGVLRDSFPNMKIGYFYDWDVMKCLVEIEAASFVKKASGENLAREAGAYFKRERPDIMFVIFDAPDGAGHKYGWYSPEYFNSLKDIDAWFGIIVQSVKEAGELENTVFVLSSDHGGLPNKNHGGKTLDELDTPFILCGSGIKRNFDITDSVAQYDVAPTVAAIFGIKKFPQVWTGRPVYQAFENP